MSVRWVRRGAALFFLLFAVAVTWPGMIPFNRIRPTIFGLPFSMAWIALWVIMSFLLFLVVDWVEGRARADAVGDDRSGGPGVSTDAPGTGSDGRKEGE